MKLDMNNIDKAYTPGLIYVKTASMMLNMGAGGNFDLHVW